MHYRVGTNDWNTLTASLNEDEYDLPTDLRGVAIDVGGYLGSVGIALALDNPGLRVVIIEPVPDNLMLIERNIRLNGVDHILLIEGAVGDGSFVDIGYAYRGSDVLEHHAYVGNSTLADGADAPHETVRYHSMTLNELVASWGPIAYMKLDTEGAEWDFLDPYGDLDQVQTIVGEAHAVGGHKGGDIVGLLERTHDVTLSGDPEGTCGFRATLRG